MGKMGWARQVMEDDYALVDFALISAEPVLIAQALDRVQLARSGAPEANARPNILARILRLGRRRQQAGHLVVVPAELLPTPPLLRLLPDDLGFGSGDHTFRLTAPVGEYGLTLLEFRETDGDTSPLCEGVCSARSTIILKA